MQQFTFRLSARHLSLTLIALLPACGPIDTKEQPPAHSYTSAKSAQDVAICISDTWDTLGAAAQMRPIQAGYTVSFLNPVTGVAALLVNVTTTSSGSSTVYYKKRIVGESGHEKAIETCQNSQPSPHQ